MVLDTIVYHPTLLKLIKFLDSTPKREKLFRTVQYLSRFLSFYLFKLGYKADVVALFKNLQSQMTFIRKSLRFLKPLNHIEDASKAYDNKLSDPILRFTTITRNLGFAGYLTLDSVVFFKLLGLIDSKKFANLPKWCNWFWFSALASSLVNDLRKIQINGLKLTSIEKGSKTNTKLETNELNVKEVKTDLYQAKRKLIWDALDMFIVLNNLKFLSYNDGEIGAAGSITSLLGLSDLWGATV